MNREDPIVLCSAYGISTLRKLCRAVCFIFFKWLAVKKDGKFYPGLQSNQEKFAKEADEFLDLVLKLRQLRLLVERRDIILGMNMKTPPE